MRANAQEYSQGFSTELMRVMLHGLLHLCGHKDKTSEEQNKIRGLEEKYLNQL